MSPDPVGERHNNNYTDRRPAKQTCYRIKQNKYAYYDPDVTNQVGGFLS